MAGIAPVGLAGGLPDGDVAAGGDVAGVPAAHRARRGLVGEACRGGGSVPVHEITKDVRGTEFTLAGRAGGRSSSKDSLK